MTEWVKKYNPLICSSQETHFKFNDINRVKTKEWKKISPATINLKKKQMWLH